MRAPLRTTSQSRLQFHPRRFSLNQSEHISLWYNLAMEDDDAVDQSENSQKPKGKAAHLAPWQFKKGQSGNPLGRTPGKSMKEFAKEYLASLTDEERLTYFEGMNKADIWKMAEGNPAN